MNKSVSAKPSLFLAAIAGVMVAAVSMLIVGKESGVITCQSNFQCQYSLAGNGWLIATAGLIGVAAASLVIWLGSKEDSHPAPELIVD